MQLISNKEFGGERPLFASHDLHLDNVTILAGESAIKECSNIVATNCRFEGNYPFWHVHGFTIQNCYFAVGGRSALWYSDHLKMTDTVIDAPKMFREMNDISEEPQTAWRHLPVHVQQRHLCGRTGKRQQICFPICKECGDTPCENHDQGCLVGSRERDYL